MAELDLKRFEPPPDPIFQYLLEQAWWGSVLVYAAEVPLKLVRRFDPNWRPERLQDGIQAMKAAMGNIGEGRMSRPWVYPRADHFVLPDDYFTLACLELLKPDSIPVWHLGVPTGGLPAHVPLSNDKVRQLIGAEPDTEKL